MHFVSCTCKGERCSICREPAAHKVGEDIPYDAPGQHAKPFPVRRHNFTTYLCCEHFQMLFGTEACAKIEEFDAMYDQHARVERRRSTDRLPAPVDGIDPAGLRSEDVEQHHDVTLSLGDEAFRKYAEGR